MMEEKIIKALEAVCDESDFKTSEDFIEDGIIDSFQIVELVGELEEVFDIDISGDDILPENFVNLAAICELISKYTED